MTTASTRSSTSVRRSAGVAASQSRSTLRIVDDADEAAFSSRVGQQVQRREADEEPVGRRARPQAERRFQRSTLRRGQALAPNEEWTQQPVQARIGQLTLRLHPRDPRRARCGADSTAYSRRRVLPIPASPTSTDTPLKPSRTAPTTRSIAARSWTRSSNGETPRDRPGSTLRTGSNLRATEYGSTASDRRTRHGTTEVAGAESRVHPEAPSSTGARSPSVASGVRRLK